MNMTWTKEIFGVQSVLLDVQNRLYNDGFAVKKDLAVGGDEDVDFAQFNTNVTWLITPDKPSDTLRAQGAGCESAGAGCWSVRHRSLRQSSAPALVRPVHALPARPRLSGVIRQVIFVLN